MTSVGGRAAGHPASAPRLALAQAGGSLTEVTAEAVGEVALVVEAGGGGDFTQGAAGARDFGGGPLQAEPAQVVADGAAMLGAKGTSQMRGMEAGGGSGLGQANGTLKVFLQERLAALQGRAGARLGLGARGLGQEGQAQALDRQWRDRILALQLGPQLPGQPLRSGTAVLGGAIKGGQHAQAKQALGIQLNDQTVGTVIGETAGMDVLGRAQDDGPGQELELAIIAFFLQAAGKDEAQGGTGVLMTGQLQPAGVGNFTYIHAGQH